MKRKFYVSQIEDEYMKQNMKSLMDFFNATPFLKGQWRFITFTVKASVTGQKFEHNLAFTPADVIVTSVIGGTITFKYDQFDKNFLVYDATVTTSTPMTVRAIIGTYTEETIGV